MILSKTLASGLGFGVTSAVITTLGLMIGLNASTGSKMVVIGGILTIAIADSLSDALGVHVSKQKLASNNERYGKQQVLLLSSNFFLP